MSDLNMPGHDDGVQGDVPPPQGESERGSGVFDRPDEDEERRLGLGQALAPPD